MNWFLFTSIVLEVGAGVSYITQGKPLFAGLWISYAVSTYILLKLAS